MSQGKVSYWTTHGLALACSVSIQCLPREPGAAHEARYLWTMNKRDHVHIVPDTSLPLPCGLDIAHSRHCRSHPPAAGTASASCPTALTVGALLHHNRSSQRCSSSSCSSPIRCVADAQPATAHRNTGTGSAPAGAAQAGPAEPCRPWRRQPGEYCGRGQHGHNQWHH